MSELNASAYSLKVYLRKSGSIGLPTKIVAFTAENEEQARAKWKASEYADATKWEWMPPGPLAS